MNSQTLLILYVVAFGALIYFFSIRPQMQRQREQAKLLAELRPGDGVVTAGGIYGSVREVRDESVDLEVADGIVLEVAKTAIVGKRL